MIKPLSKNNPYRLFLGTLRKHWLAYSLGMCAMLITSFSEVMLPKFIQWAIELSTHKGEGPAFFRRADAHETLNVMIAFLLINLTIGWLGRVLWRQILARQTHKAGHHIKTKIWSVLKDQPLSLLDRHSLGDLMNRATGDWNRTRFIHGFTIVMTFDLIFFTLLSTISMMMIDVSTALLCMVVLPFLPRKIIKISKEEYKLHDFAQEQLSLLSDLISQAVNTIRLQRSTASEGIWLERLGSYANEYAKRQFQVLKASWRIFIIAAIPTLFSYGVLYTYGIHQIQNGTLTIGAFLALQSYVLLLQSPLFELGNNISEWQTGFASYKRISELYDLEQNEVYADEPSGDIHDVAILTQNLSLTYGQDRMILDSINLKVSLGDRVGFIGPIGSGKSTLVHAIAGLSENFSGGIWVCGSSVDSSSREWMTAKITMAPQKPFLFAGSIRHNLAPAVTLPDHELIEALRCVELWNDVEQFPEGLASWIGEWGINLSGGQKQRLSLARALLKPSPILILDDCLSAVDSVTEAKILHNLGLFLENRAVLWTAHRLSSLQLCNRIFRLENGTIRDIAQLHTDTQKPISELSGREIDFATS
ncbi:MAG: ABC transporter ATP-binding protein [Chitinophagaceae bacterium]|nr:ABC transporter ATP-binding protein [Oligoflexus sp.]